MSNELVYGDATKFVSGLNAAEADAHTFFDEAVTYLSACVKTLSLYRESQTEFAAVPPAAWDVKVESGEEWFKLASNYATLTLARSRPLGTVRFLLAENAEEASPFTRRSAEGYILFTGEAAKENQKKKAPGIFVTGGYVPAHYKTDAAASFAEPLFWQLFQPLPVEPAPSKNGEARS